MPNEPEIPKALHEDWTQLKNWHFTQKDLQSTYVAVNLDAIKRCKLAIKEENSYKGKDLSEAELDKIPFLSGEEERKLILYFVIQLPLICRKLKLADNVRATALSYFRRFYLKCSVLEYDPKHIMVTCLFLATKVESHAISLDAFLRPIPKMSREVVLEHEMIITSALKFNLWVRGVYAPMLGWLLDMSREGTEIDGFKAKAKQWCDDAISGDVMFLHSPTQVALGCLLVAAEDVGKDEEIEAYLKSKFELEVYQRLRDKISDVMDGIRHHSELLKTYKEMPEAMKEELKKLNQRLSYCRNPARNPESQVFKRKRKRAQEKAGERRRKRAKRHEDDERVLD